MRRTQQRITQHITNTSHLLQQIDWHDFVVVETIDFFDEEDLELPPPMSLKELLAFNKQQQMQQGGGAGGAGGGEVEMGEGGGEAAANGTAGEVRLCVGVF